MISSKELTRAEEAIIADIARVELSIRVSRQLKDKKGLVWQEKELRELKKAKDEILKEKENAINHEIRIKENKQRKEWFRKHPDKTLIDYHEAVTIPRLKKIDEKLKKRGY